MLDYNELHIKYLIMLSFTHNKNYKDDNTFKKVWLCMKAFMQS